MLNKNINYISVSVVIFIVALIAGCGEGRERSSNCTSGCGDQLTVEKQRLFSMNVVVSGVPFWSDTKSAWETINTKRSDVDLSYGGPLDTNAQNQIDEVKALISKGVNGLIIAPADSSSVTSVINEAVDLDIPVVTYLIDAPSSNRLAYITSELEESSKKIARHVTQNVSETAEAMIVYAEAGNEEQERRRNGFLEFINAHDQLNLVTEITDSYNEREGADKIKAALIKHPDIKYIFGSNSRSAVGAALAIKELNIPIGNIVVTGWDTDDDVLKLIEDGWVSATAAQQSAFMTQLAFSILDSYTNGSLYPANRDFKNNKVRPLPEIIRVPILIVEQSNVQGFFSK